MPKMRGFMRGKPKIDDAEWAIAQMRTAARLGDLFPSEEAAGKEKEARDKAKGADAATDLSTIVVGPGPWSGGPRPPIVVVGVSDVASVLPKTGTVQPTIISATAPTVDPPAAQPAPAVAEPVPTPAGPVVVAAAERVAVDETLSPAKPIGRATRGDGGPNVTGVMAEPHDVSPAKPIGVMARVGDAVGDDTWRLPEATPPPAPALVREVPTTPGLPPAAHVFAKQRHEDHADDDLSSLVRPKPAGGPAVRSLADSAPLAASATTGRGPRTRPVVARALAESSAGTSASPVRPAPAARP
nr:hypothetical protein [Chloroflexota bacterium]